MRQQTYERMKKLYPAYSGYISTKELLKEGFSNRQIALLQEEGYLEKIANGYFWMSCAGIPKPVEYKAISVNFVNKEAVIIADSACYYQGLIDVEPKRISIATKRTDRHQMIFPFEVTRHFLSERAYEEGMKKIKTKFGSFTVYEVARSVCDCIRFRESIEPDIFDLIIENFKKEKIGKETRERLLAYARMMKFEEKAKGIL